MPLPYMLWHCLRHGQTKVMDHGTKTAPGTKKEAVLKPRNDECVLVFAPDCDAFRREYSLIGSPVCDGVIFFAAANRDHPSLILIELKGDDFCQAVAQLESVARVLQRQYPPHHDSAQTHKHLTNYLAVIVSSSSAPNERSLEFERISKRLASLHVKLRIKGGVKRGQSADLRKYLDD